MIDLNTFFWSLGVAVTILVLVPMLLMVGAYCWVKALTRLHKALEITELVEHAWRQKKRMSNNV